MRVNTMRAERECPPSIARRAADEASRALKDARRMLQAAEGTQEPAVASPPKPDAAERRVRSPGVVDRQSTASNATRSPARPAPAPVSTPPPRRAPTPDETTVFAERHLRAEDPRRPGVELERARRADSRSERESGIDGSRSGSDSPLARRRARRRRPRAARAARTRRARARQGALRGEARRREGEGQGGGVFGGRHPEAGEERARRVGGDARFGSEGRHPDASETDDTERVRFESDHHERARGTKNEGSRGRVGVARVSRGGPGERLVRLFRVALRVASERSAKPGGGAGDEAASRSVFERRARRERRRAAAEAASRGGHGGGKRVGARGVPERVPEPEGDVSRRGEVLRASRKRARWVGEEPTGVGGFVGGFGRVSRVYAGESFCRDASRRVSQTHAQERHAAGAAVRGRLVARVPLAARQLRSGAGVAAEIAGRLLERRRRLRSGDAPRRGG